MLIDNRYEIIEEFLHGAQSETVLARKIENDQKVVIKKISLKELTSWKQAELFQREGDILKMLSYPSIPGYIETFTLEEAQSLYIVQEYIQGENLRVFREKNALQERDILEMIMELLKTLLYLQSFHPPIIHRDIKPENIIISPDRGVYLIDFGAVQSSIGKATGGSTIVGTIGYMAPEQLMGKASPKSDLYAVGAVMLHLFTGKDPAELPSEDMQINYKGVLKLSPDLQYFLDQLIASKESERFQKISEAIDMLDLIIAGKPIHRPKPAIQKPVQQKPAGQQPITVVERILFITPLIVGLCYAAYIYLLNFNSYSETAMIKATPFWLVPALFGFGGLSTGNPNRLVGAVKWAAISLALLIFFIHGIFPSM